MAGEKAIGANTLPLPFQFLAAWVTIHAADGNCYWHDARDSSAKWGFIGHP